MLWPVRPSVDEAHVADGCLSLFVSEAIGLTECSANAMYCDGK